MGYKKAMEAAGATVHLMQEFGSYQGDWWAKVTHNGTTGWVNGSYGSCSGCDAFEGEFYCDSHEHTNTYVSSYNIDEEFDPTCEACVSYRKRLAEFGQGYLDGIVTAEAALTQAGEHLEWDSDAKQMVEFIQNNS